MKSAVLLKPIRRKESYLTAIYIILTSSPKMVILKIAAVMIKIFILNILNQIRTTFQFIVRILFFSGSPYISPKLSKEFFLEHIRVISFAQCLENGFPTQICIRIFIIFPRVLKMSFDTNVNSNFLFFLNTRTSSQKL